MHNVRTIFKVIVTHWAAIKDKFLQIKLTVVFKTVLHAMFRFPINNIIGINFITYLRRVTRLYSLNPIGINFMSQIRMKVKVFYSNVIGIVFDSRLLKKLKLREFFPKFGIAFESLYQRKRVFRLIKNIAISISCSIRRKTAFFSGILLNVDLICRLCYRAVIHFNETIEVCFEAILYKQKQLEHANKIGLGFISQLALKKSFISDINISIDFLGSLYRKIRLRCDNSEIKLVTLLNLKNYFINELKGLSVNNWKINTFYIPQFKIEFEANLQKL